MNDPAAVEVVDGAQDLKQQLSNVTLRVQIPGRAARRSVDKTLLIPTGNQRSSFPTVCRGFT